ncbi:MAG: aminopeptidase P family protein [Planctomycetes bacterium]|nr:aminopeptidase P family protein [Planctomycetota bacterium]
MQTERHVVRRRKLLTKLRKTKSPTLLITCETNVSYLTGFSGDSSFLLLGRGVEILISDTRYTTQIREECPDLDVYIRDSSEEIETSVANVTKKAKLREIAFESHSLTIARMKKLQTENDRVKWIAAGGVIEELREIKDASEIAEIRSAVDQAQRGFECLRAALMPAMTELEVAHDLEHAMRRFGALGAAFEPIVAVGSRAALPHARPGRTQIRDAEFTLIDWGATSVGGYRSDLTRVLITGRILPKLEKIYGVVLKAQQQAIRAIRPGVACRDVDAVARRIIEDAGFGKYFGHGLGHGIGLDIHEGPRFSPISKSTLKPGMVITVEPGIYLPGWGGVRIEDDVLVSKDGCEVLTSVPKDFESVLCR